MRGVAAAFVALALAVGTAFGDKPSVTVRHAPAEDDHAPEEFFHPVPYDPAKPPPTAQEIEPTEWFKFMSKMHEYQGIHCEEKKSLNQVYDFLRAQFDRQKARMRYERIVGALFVVNSDRGATWYGFCIEHVLADGNAEPHPKVVKTFQAAYDVVHNSDGGVEKRYKTPKRETPFPVPPGLAHGNLDDRDFKSHRVGDSMYNLCHCSCAAAPPRLATNDPLGCTCHCKPQHGGRGGQGVHGPAGARGPRGPPGTVGSRGPRGSPGRLPLGKYPLETCKCYNEMWDRTMASSGWSECNQPGYLLQGIWRDSCTSIDCVHVARCCRPCLKISSEPPKPKIRYSSRRTKDVSFEGMKPAAYRKIFRAARGGRPASRSKGYCSRLLSDFRHESNKRTCYHGGSTKDIITRVTLRFSPSETEAWRFRFGADFDTGGMITVDGHPWADGSGKSLTWDRNWDSGAGVLTTESQMLEGGVWHKVVVWGISRNQNTAVMEFEFNNGNGWTSVSVPAITAASRPSEQNSGA